jgi:putative N6-adenine-specific DNA methylase
MFATAAPGLEPLLTNELKSLGADDARAEPGGVAFSGDVATLYSANLWLRTAGRVLMRLARFPVYHLAELERRAKKIPWNAWLDSEKPISVAATCHKSKIYHSVAAAERVASGIATRLGLTALPPHKAAAPEEAGGAVTVLVRIARDRCAVSLDSSGAHLHRRGYRTECVRAPLRENLAAAALIMSRFESPGSLLDPMCGSGTLPIEAAMSAGNIAPGRHRRFAFMDWAGWHSSLWRELLAAADEAARVPGGRIFALDVDADAVAMTARNAKRAGVSAFVDISRGDVRSLEAQGPPGLVIANPPYGKRVGDGRRLKALYRDMGRRLAGHLSNWRVALLTSDPGLAAATGLCFAETSPPFPNGGVRVKLYLT